MVVFRPDPANGEYRDRRRGLLPTPGAECVSELARERCIVATALDIPIRLTAEVEAAVQKQATA